MSTLRKASDSLLAGLPPRVAHLLFSRRLKSRARHRRPSQDLSYQIWLQNHGHVVNASQAPLRKASDPQELIWRWTRRYLLQRRRRRSAEGKPLPDNTLEVWKNHHATGGLKPSRPQPAPQTPPTRRRRRPRRAFSEELDLPLVASTEQGHPFSPLWDADRIEARRRYLQTALQGVPRPRPTAVHRRTGFLRVLLFTLRSVRRMARVAIRGGQVPPTLVKPDPELDALDANVQKVLDRLFQGRFQDVQHSDELLRGIRKLLEADDDPSKDEELQAKDAQIQLLENKIRRLAALLQENERQRERMREAEAEARRQSPFQKSPIPGVKAGDPNRKAKLDLMRQIREMNRQIRADIQTLSAPPTAGASQDPEKDDSEAKRQP